MPLYQWTGEGADTPRLFYTLEKAKEEGIRYVKSKPQRFQILGPLSWDDDGEGGFVLTGAMDIAFQDTALWIVEVPDPE